MSTNDELPWEMKRHGGVRGQYRMNVKKIAGFLHFERPLGLKIPSEILALTEEVIE
jgi:hypothetical protein